MKNIKYKLFVSNLYLCRWSRSNEKNKAYGMLLYSQTINEPSVNVSYEIDGHKILVKTLDINSTWGNIINRLIM